MPCGFRVTFVTHGPYIWRKYWFIRDDRERLIAAANHKGKLDQSRAARPERS